MWERMPVEDMAEMFAPGIKSVMEENKELKHQLEVAQARIDELHLIIDKLVPKDVI